MVYLTILVKNIYFFNFLQDDITPSSESNLIMSPTRRRISDGIISIMSKLNLSRENSVDANLDVSIIYSKCNKTYNLLLLKFQNDPNKKLVCPLKIDMYCNNNTETALHAAVKGKHYDIVFSLLKSGANVNVVIKAYHDINEVSFYKIIR